MGTELRRDAGDGLTSSLSRLLALLMVVASGTLQAQVQPCPSARVDHQPVPGCEQDAKPVPPPMRLLTTVCPPDAIVGDGCHGRFRQLAGSGGAEVQSFHIELVTKSNALSIEWTCPDPEAMVVAVLDLDGYRLARREKCAAGRVQWPAAELPRGSSRVFYPRAFVRLGNDPVEACRIPVYLLARLSIPEGTFKSGSTCTIISGHACAIVYSRFAGKWSIAVRGTEVDRGGGQMSSRRLRLRPPADCLPSMIYVDFDPAENAPRSPVAEVHF